MTRRWRRAIGALTRGRFRSFDEVAAPSKNLMTEPGPKTQHFDGFADGQVPVSGWLPDPQRRHRTSRARTSSALTICP
jgi:hypothetical protein